MSGTPPLRFAICLFPGFQALDVFGPLDCLNLHVRLGAPIESFILNHSLEPVETRPGEKFSQSIVPTHTYDDPPEDVDVVFVPGGFGLRDLPALIPLKSYLSTLKSSNSLKYLLTVCTGSAVVSSVGLLDGLSATTNKRSWDWAVAHSSSVKWVREARWVVDKKEGKEYWTSSGVSAGMDMTLAWIERVEGGSAGKDRAEEIARVMEYEWHTDSKWDPFSKIWLDEEAKTKK